VLVSDDTVADVLPYGKETMGGSYSGKCFCGAVELRVSGQPNAMGYCHCQSCRSWSSDPVNAFTLWSLEAVEVTQGAENVATYHKAGLSHRQFSVLPMRDGLPKLGDFSTEFGGSGKVVPE